MYVDRNTQICGSIAHKASSLGAAMYNAAYENLELNFIYIPFSTVDTEGAVCSMRALGIRGLAAGDPHNTRVAPYLDEIDPVAMQIGSINTIYNNNGVLKGYNSDWIGFVTAFTEIANLSGRRVIVLGAGGACRSVVYALTQEKVAQVIILNRSIEKARSIAEMYGVECGNLEKLSNFKGFDTLINTTSVGSASTVEQKIVPKHLIEPFDIVADVVFYPPETPLIADAKSLGKMTMQGWRMLLHQGMFQFKLFTGVEPPVQFIGDILYNNLTK